MPLLWIFDSSVTVSGLRIFTEPIVEPIFPQKLLFKSIQILIWTTETSTCEHQDEPGRMDNRRKAKTFIIIAKSPKLLASEKGEQFEFKRSKDRYIVLRMDWDLVLNAATLPKRAKVILVCSIFWFTGRKVAKQPVRVTLWSSRGVSGGD